MRKTITLGLSIILCLVGSLVLLSLVEVEQVVRAAPKKTKTTYNVALVPDNFMIPDGDGGVMPLPLCSDSGAPNSGDLGEVQCQLSTDQLSPQIWTQELERDAATYNVNFQPSGPNVGAFDGVTLCDDSVLVKLSIYFRGNNKRFQEDPKTSDKFTGFFGDSFSTPQQTLTPVTPIPSDLTYTCPKCTGTPFDQVNGPCASFNIGENAVITLNEVPNRKNSRRPLQVFQHVRYGDLHFQEVDPAFCSATTIITVGSPVP